MSARIPYGVSPSTMATIRMTMPYRLSMRLLKKSACSTSLSRNLRYATPRIAEKMTTAMVEVDRAPARSAKGFVGMNERISCGSVRLAASLCWEASDESSAASGVAGIEEAACASPVRTVAPQPSTAANGHRAQQHGQHREAMRPKCSVTSARVNAPTMATNTSGMTSIFNKPI